MTHGRSALLRNSVLTVAVLAAVTGTPHLFIAAAMAQQSNVSLDNYSVTGPDGATLTIKHVDFNGTNLSKDEITKLLDPSTPKDQMAALQSKLIASEINMPDATVTSPKAKFNLHGLDAKNVKSGKIDHVTLTSMDGTGSVGDAGDAVFNSGAMSVDGLDVSSMLSAATSGKFGDGTLLYSHFTWAGMNVTFPDKDTPKTATGGNLYKVAVGSVDATQTYSDNIPLKSAATVNGITITPPPASQAGQGMGAFGYPSVQLGFSVSGTYDPATKNFSLANYSITGVNAGTLALMGSFGDIDKAVFAGSTTTRLPALAAGNVSNVQLSFVNQGLFEKSLAFAATMEHKSAAAVQKEWTGAVTQMLPMILGGDPAGKTLANAIAAFIASPKSLTITVAAKGGTPIKFSDLMSLASPEQVLSLIDITAVADK